MEKGNYKCSSKDHENIEAISYCKKCDIYICNKCENIHSKLCQNHQIYKLEKNINEIFTGFCTEEMHNEKLEFFCKNHNKLCCASCLCKIKDKGKGQHKDCDVCILESIKEEKQNKLKENINKLENFEKNINDSLEKLKNMFEQINENKEKLKLNIQTIFTKLRNTLNEREDELLLEVENLYKNTYFDENLIKESEKLPTKIKASIEKGKELGKEIIEDNLLIHNCIIIENDIKVIETINESISKSKNFNNIKIDFIDSKEILTDIKKFGSIIKYNDLIDLNNSLIINNSNYIKNLIEWLGPKSKIKTELLYRKSRDGDSYDKFHELCDNKGKSLIIIKGKENFIIGAYTPINWNNNYGGWECDDETFLFSLTKSKIYRKKEKSFESIYCHKNSGPWFGGIGFRDSGKKNMTQGEFAYSRNDYEFFGNINDIIPNEGKSRFFDVEEVEIYKLMF